MRVFIVAEPSLFEEGIEELLRQEEGLEIVGREEDPHEAVRRIRECLPDVVVFTDGEGATELEAELLRLVREGLHVRIVEVHLETNTVCIYCGERHSIREAGDLVRTVQHVCDALGREARVPLA
ncbi:MAG TPA: hypothetical protein VMW58_06425 [Anaerolineae bacterium]|nr:hypothetical protein [Anaerolineae bacterium]